MQGSYETGWKRSEQRFSQGKLYWARYFATIWLKCYGIFCFQEEIKNALDKACTIIPEKRLRGKCRDSIKNRGNQIADAIAGNLSGDNICKILGYC